MIVMGLDPGTEQSALVTWTGTTVESVIEANPTLLKWLRESQQKQSVLVIEEFESYGMAVGREVFRTVRWAGNFEEAWHPGRVEFLPRRAVKQHICHTARATDANIRTELLDRFGGPTVAIGTKREPGPLYYVKSHGWAALAVAITWMDQHGHDVRPGVVPDF